MAAVLVGKLLVLNEAIATGTFPTQRADLPATIAILLMLVAPLLWLGARARIPALLCVNAVVTTLLAADRIHMRFFDDVLSTAALAHAGQIAWVGRAAAERIAVSDALLYLDAVAGALVWAIWVRRAPLTDWPLARRRVIWGMIAVACLLAVLPVRLIWLDPEEVFLYATRRREVAAALGVVPYHVYDLGLHVHQLTRRMRVSPGNRQMVNQFFDARRAAAAAPSTLFGHAHGRNVIVIMAESLTSLPLDLVVGGRPVTPSLSAFARDSIRFTNFFDQTHLGTTADAELSSMQSLLPLPDAVTATRYPANRFAGLPAALGERGYHTLSASVMPGDFWNMRQMHRSVGFARSFFRDEFSDGEAFGMGLTDEVFFEQIDDRLETAPEPFMAFLLTLSNHVPYELPLHHRTLDVGELEGTDLGRYLQSVHYFDRAFGALIERLQQSGLLDRSLVAVYGDHRAFWEDTPEIPALLGFAGGDRYRTWTAERRLPFLIRLPEGAGARTVSGAASHVDIAPTVLPLLGVSSHDEVMVGRNLLADSSPLVVFRDGSVIAGDHLATSATGSVPSECFHLHTGAPVDCGLLNEGRRQARRQMDVSDLVIRGNLIASLRRPQPAAGPRHVLVIGHRGNPADAPENTLASIASAFALGCDLVEIDVRLTRDGVPVIMHDETVDRTTDGTGHVADLTLAELKALDAGSWKHARFAGERIPTLAEALRVAQGKGTLLLDLPVSGMGAVIAETFRAAGLPFASARLATWDDPQRREMAAHMPGATIIQADGVPVDWDAGYLDARRAAGVDMFDVGAWPPGFVPRARAAGMPVWVYTINDPQRMREVIRQGVDGFETDVPGMAIAIARELGMRQGPRARP